MRELGLMPWLDMVIGYDSGHGRKPEPGPILGFAAAHGLAPDEIVLVGDSTHDLTPSGQQADWRSRFSPLGRAGRNWSPMPTMSWTM